MDQLGPPERTEEKRMAPCDSDAVTWTMSGTEGASRAQVPAQDQGAGTETGTETGVLSI